MRTSKTVTAIAVALMLVIGLIHFIDARDALGDAQYKGILFLANGLGSLIAAFGIVCAARSWGWGLGLLISVSTFIAYILSRTVGLPGLPAEPGKWFEPLGIASFAAEGAFALLAVWVLWSKSAQRPAEAHLGN